MSGTWSRVLAGSAVVAILLGVSVLGIANHRTRVDASLRAGSNPGDRLMSPRPDDLVTQEARPNLEAGLPADWEATEPAVAQDQKNLTEEIQTGRLTVLKVNKETRQIVSLNSVGRVRVAKVSEQAVVVAEDRKAADLALVKAGDLIQLEPRDGRIQRIVVLRRAWHETASPEQ